MTYNKLKTIDLKGEVCPYTFVLTKLNLEEMDVNTVLEVIVDYLPAVENIPRSVKEQNLGEILSVDKIGNNEWKLIIKKT
ncbi:MAG: sulfurtransferase TusA family protein [Promethearchaeota archaeon]